MAIAWFATAAKQGADVKITNNNITVTSSGLEKLREINPAFENAGNVLLGWDSDEQLVAIAPSDASANAFKFGKRGRTQTSRTVNAAKLFEAFGVPANGVTDGVIKNVDGVAVFSLTAPKEVAPVRRGRGRPKAQPATE